MAICLVVFNPANSKRILMNYHYVVNEFKLQGLPVFSLELVYENRQPQIADAFHVYAKSYMFHKENLCRLLEKRIPETYTKLAFIDADVIFKDKQWYSKVSQLLETHDVVQPFETVNLLDLTYRKVLVSKYGILKVVETFKQIQSANAGEPGFVWCFRRDWYNRVGFFDDNPIGGGDSLFIGKCLNLNHAPLDIDGINILINSKYSAYKKLENPKITYLKDSIIFHLYHGSRKNRQYWHRNFIFKNNTKSFDELSYINEYGVYEWKEPDIWNPKFLQYFLERYDDDLSCECSK